MNIFKLKELDWGVVDEEMKFQRKFRDAHRWEDMEVIRPGKEEKDASAPRLLMVASRQGQSATERGCF